MKWVIWHPTRKKYVRGDNYTKSSKQATKWPTRKAALDERYAGERVVKLEE